jgi:hypothetical protein
LSEVCKELDHCDEHQQYQTGRQKCQYYRGRDSSIFRHAEPIVQEEYLRLRAFLCQGLADQHADDVKVHQELSEEAMGYWEDYFTWLWGLDAETGAAVLNRTRNIIFVREAVAGLGTTALSAGKPSDAWPYYETFNNDWFGSDALNQWLATLIYPDRQKRVDDTIFTILAEKQKSLKDAVADESRTDHWRKFEAFLKGLLGERNCRFSKSRYEPFLRQLTEVLPPTDSPKEVTRN